MKKSISIFWFRRDLRLEDNHSLFQALSSDFPVLPIFIFDTDILSALPKDDHRVGYIHQQLMAIHEELATKHNSGLHIYHGRPQKVFEEILEKYDVQGVYTNRDYEPYGKKRDAAINGLLDARGIDFFTYKDQVIFEEKEIVKNDATPYVVYTPYMKKWRLALNPSQHLTQYNHSDPNYVSEEGQMLSLADIGFTQSSITMPVENIELGLMNHYGSKRDYPAEPATSHVGTALRFGTISIRRLVARALQSDDETYLKELIWREFFMQVFWHFPYTQHRAFREKYEAVPWRDAPKDLQKWKDGETGYPIVDAGMRELNQTGYMHNRVRMVVASFLCKHLLIDWREGERYFAEKLFDYEMSSNVGNWQWAAGTGVDAAPYFRVFNPETQMKKFDSKGIYIRKWVPEYFGIGYVNPIVEHSFARKRALETYKIALENYPQQG